MRLMMTKKQQEIMTKVYAFLFWASLVVTGLSGVFFVTTGSRRFILVGVWNALSMVICHRSLRWVDEAEVVNEEEKQ